MDKHLFEKLIASFRYFLRVFKILFRAGKFYVIAICCTGIILGITPSVSLLVMQRIINLLQLKTVEYKQFLVLFVIYIAIDVGQSGCGLIMNYCEQRIQLAGSLYVQMSILEKVSEFRLKDFESSEIYDILQRAMQVNFTRIYNYFKSFLVAVQSLISIIILSYVLYVWKKWIIGIVLIIPIVNTCVNMFFAKARFSIIKKRAPLERKVWYLQYLLTKDTAFKEIEVFNLGDYLRAQYKVMRKKFINQDMLVLNRSSIAKAITALCECLIDAAVLGYTFFQAVEKKILIGDLTTYIRSISNIKSSVQAFLMQSTSIYEATLYIKQYFELLDRKSCSPKAALLSSSMQEVNISSVEVRNLSYRYSNQSQLALNQINLKINQNNLVAFVGPNGSGKTTLVKILANLYDDYSGTVLFGNRDVSIVPPKELMRKIGILFQDFTRYELSVRENIAFGNLEKIEATSEIKKLISDVGLAENFRNLDEQLGSWFENGKQLSGGEWLKIALARAFIRDADLYLLDEPNSALDPISEKIVFNSFKKLVKNKIGIVVSHRISSIKDIADQIVVFNNGKIEAIGSHEELLKKSVTYHNLYMNETQNCHILK